MQWKTSTQHAYIQHLTFRINVCNKLINSQINTQLLMGLLKPSKYLPKTIQETQLTDYSISKAKSK